jgi:hypothetical protein
VKIATTVWFEIAGNVINDNDNSKRTFTEMTKFELQDWSKVEHLRALLLDAVTEGREEWK